MPSRGRTGSRASPSALADDSTRNDTLRRDACSGLKPTEQWDHDLLPLVHAEDVAARIQLALEQANLPPFAVYTRWAADSRCAEPTVEILRRFRPDLSERDSAAGRSSVAAPDRPNARTFGYASRYCFGR